MIKPFCMNYLVKIPYAKEPVGTQCAIYCIDFCLTKVFVLLLYSLFCWLKHSEICEGVVSPVMRLATIKPWWSFVKFGLILNERTGFLQDPSPQKWYYSFKDLMLKVKNQLGGNCFNKYKRYTKETIKVLHKYPTLNNIQCSTDLSTCKPPCWSAYKTYFIIKIYLNYTCKIIWNLYYSLIFELLLTAYFTLFMRKFESETHPIIFPQLPVQVVRVNHKAKAIPNDSRFMTRCTVKQVLLHSTRDLFDCKWFW